jgi:hypothetical protein
VVVGLARQADGLARAGDDQAVTVEVEPPAGGRASGQAPAAADEVDAVDRGQDRLGRDLGRDPVQVLAPLAMGGTGPAAVDPVSVAAMVNQVMLPRPAADLVADPLGILAPGVGVREADVLLWWGAAGRLCPKRSSGGGGLPAQDAYQRSRARWGMADDRAMRSQQAAPAHPEQRGWYVYDWANTRLALWELSPPSTVQEHGRLRVANNRCRTAGTGARRSQRLP